MRFARAGVCVYTKLRAASNLARPANLLSTKAYHLFAQSSINGVGSRFSISRTNSQSYGKPSMITF